MRVETRKLGSIFLAILTVSFIVSVGIAAIALSHYADVFDGPVSQNHSTWAEFGDFVGGILNPILGFVSVMALLMTVWLQSQELRATRHELERAATAHEKHLQSLEREERKEDLYRLIQTAFDEMQAEIGPRLRQLIGPGKHQPQFDRYRSIGCDPLAQHEESDFFSDRELLLDPFAKALRELADLLMTYDIIGDTEDAVVTDFYRRRVERYTWDLYELGVIGPAYHDILKPGASHADRLRSWKNIRR